MNVQSVNYKQQALKNKTNICFAAKAKPIPLFFKEVDTELAARKIEKMIPLINGDKSIQYRDNWTIEKIFQNGIIRESNRKNTETGQNIIRLYNKKGDLRKKIEINKTPEGPENIVTYYFGETPKKIARFRFLNGKMFYSHGQIFSF